MRAGKYQESKMRHGKWRELAEKGCRGGIISLFTEALISSIFRGRFVLLQRSKAPVDPSKPAFEGSVAHIRQRFFFPRRRGLEGLSRND